jgi:hypothetical protein
MAYLYANENFPLQVVEALRVLGHEVLANQSIPDEQVLDFAIQNRRSLLTLNILDLTSELNEDGGGVL